MCACARARMREKARQGGVPVGFSRTGLIFRTAHVDDSLVVTGDLPLHHGLDEPLVVQRRSTAHDDAGTRLFVPVLLDGLALLRRVPVDLVEHLLATLLFPCPFSSEQQGFGAA